MIGQETVRPIRLYVDETHMGRRATGIERITSVLFSPAAFPELDVKAVRSTGGRLSMVLSQSFGLPLRALRDRSATWVFPGYPPTPFFGRISDRAAMYVHDLFLVTRPQDLNAAARYYMAPSFRRALRRFRTFLVNSEATADELRGYVRPDADIILYRPVVDNVFALDARLRPDAAPDRPLVLGSLGTVEPRKNYLAAASIRAALQEKLGRPTILRIIGRRGWGDDYDRLAQDPNVELVGFLDDAQMRSTIDTFDLFLCTSHAEGLGLPLLEVQHAGLPVIAPDQPVFREVLGSSGIFIQPDDPVASADVISARLAASSLADLSSLALGNITRWNETARGDRAAVLEQFRRLARGTR